MNSRNNLLLIASWALSLTFLSHRLSAQDPPIVWGDIPRSDLEMKTYPPDTNASAVILCDYGESYVDEEYNLIFTRHLRVKILTAAGFDFGNHAVVLWTKKKTERIYDIKGATYWLDDHNEVSSAELAGKDIFEEAVDDNHTRCRFTLPLLKPGCVIEIRYRILTENLWFVRDWWFQYSEPARWSEYRIYAPQNIGFMTVFTKNQPFAVKENVDEKCRFAKHSSMSYGEDEMQCYKIRLAMKDVPALRDEPYSTTMNDYRSKVDVQFSGWATLTGGVHNVLTDWQKLVNDLMKNDYFGDRIDDTRKVRAQTNAVVSGLTTPEEKLAALYRWVATSIVWSGKKTLTADHEVDDVLESKSGSSSEIVFLFLSMLKTAGLSADPVILSTRENGKIQDAYPVIDQFNYVVARVVVGDREYFLDPTDPQRPMNLLPPYALNVKALVVNTDSMKWVNLVTAKRHVVASSTSLELREDGSLSGSVDDRYSEYAALLVRQDLVGEKVSDVAKKKLGTESAGIALDSVSISVKDSVDQALDIHGVLSSPSYAVRNGDILYFNPHLFHREKENPFKTKDRSFPVDYSYARETTALVTLTLPDSFEISERPADKSFAAPGNAAVFSRNVNANGREIHIVYKFEVRQSKVDPAFYTGLRDFYSKVVAAESDQFVLKRIRKIETQTPADSLGQQKSQPPKASRKKKKDVK